MSEQDGRLFERFDRNGIPFREGDKPTSSNRLPIKIKAASDDIEENARLCGAGRVMLAPVSRSTMDMKTSVREVTGPVTPPCWPEMRDRRAAPPSSPIIGIAPACSGDQSR